MKFNLASLALSALVITGFAANANAGEREYCRTNYDSSCVRRVERCYPTREVVVEKCYPKREVIVERCAPKVEVEYCRPVRKVIVEEVIVKKVVPVVTEEVVTQTYCPTKVYSTCETYRPHYVRTSHCETYSTCRR